MVKTTTTHITEWFDLKRYDLLKIMDLKGWRRQLLLRRYIKYGLEGRPEWSEFDCKIRRENAINEWMPIIKNQPIFDKSYENHLITWLPSLKSILDYTFNQRTVMSSVVSDFYNEKVLHKIREKALPKLEATLTQQELQIIDDVPFDYFLKESGADNKGAFTHVTIDLTATDEQIKEDFGKWLKEYRKSIGYTPNDKLRGKQTAKKFGFGAIDLKVWFDSRLLPCIDLDLVALAEMKNDKKITCKEMARLLFPEEVYQDNDNETKIRKTIRPKAGVLLSDEVLNAINLQIK
jgi:hypothetical protein